MDLGGGGGGGGGREKSISEHAVNVSGRCMVARQESSALLGCVFENARQMWFLVAAHLSSCHGGCGHDDAPWSAAWRCISKDFLRAGKEVSGYSLQSTCLAHNPLHVNVTGPL